MGPVSRTTGLIQAGDNPATGVGEWPLLADVNFAVNPIDPSAIMISAPAAGGPTNLPGTVFLTSGPSLGFGKQWFPIALPNEAIVGGAGTWDGTYAPAEAFGAPAVGASSPLDNFLYVGTTGGHIYVSFTGGGTGGGNAWHDLSTGLDGSTVEQIVTDPVRGSHDAYAVTDTGVFYMPDSSVPGAAWINITSNLFSPALMKELYNDPTMFQATLESLHTIQADWRYAIPNNLAAPPTATITFNPPVVAGSVKFSYNGVPGTTVGLSPGRHDGRPGPGQSQHDPWASTASCK